jgi:predicted phosphate transport protein (TIGR00153 family)
MGFKEWIIPQDRVFYDLLEKHIGLARKATEEFQQMLSNWNNVEVWRDRIRAIEHEADMAGHEIFDRLNRTFITPLDREDIARLAHRLDNIVDSLDAATNRIAMLDFPQPTPPMRQFADILGAQVRELEDGIRALRKPKTLKSLIPRHTVEIHRLENQADKVLNDSLAALFKTKDAFAIIKHKEVYELLETATDCCEDVADVLNDILRKHG